MLFIGTRFSNLYTAVDTPFSETQDEILILKTQGRGFKSPVDRRGPDRGLLLGAVCYGGTNLLGCRLQILQIEEQ